MMKNLCAVFLILAGLGCAKVNLKTSEPIKVDINMRVDVYQHVVNEVNSIEDMIYGDTEKKLNWLSLIPAVYAADNFQAAIDRRRQRSDTVDAYSRAGCIGENHNAYLEYIGKSASECDRATVEEILAGENEDRRIIYAHTAQTNGVSRESVEKIFFDDHYKRAPGGYFFQVYDAASGRFEWQKK